MTRLPLSTRSRLRHPMGRRQFLTTGAAAMGGLILPGAVSGQAVASFGDGTAGSRTMKAQDAPAEWPGSSLDMPPSQNTATPEAPVGGRFEEGLLPDHRLIMYYGFPENPNMGILGQYSPEDLLPLLQEQRAAYEAAAPDRPWKMGIELIASVAQRGAGEDGMYVRDTPGEFLDLYTQFTEANDMYLLLDVQCGLKTPKEDYEGLERWVRYDHVHLAIDPEFHVLPGETPGIELGSIDASDVTEAQQWCVDIANKYGTSRKMLLIHQFSSFSISNKEQIAPMDGVDLVLNMDGFGAPHLKLDTWGVIIQQQPIQYNGIKLFYDQDVPLMTPEDVMALEPIPDVINYQ